MTTSPTMPFQMGAVLKNIELRGSTMGSRKEFADMVKFVQDMKAGKQFGKLVIEVSKEQDAKL